MSTASVTAAAERLSRNMATAQVALNEGCPAALFDLHLKAVISAAIQTRQALQDVDPAFPVTAQRAVIEERLDMLTDLLATDTERT